jgi:hypothetical protein
MADDEPMPKNRREARAWVRRHWARFMLSADMPDDAMDCEHIWEVWNDEGRRCANRITTPADSSNDGAADV